MGGGPKYIHRDITNQAVLDALVALTGHNFNFDKEAWIYWYAWKKRRTSRRRDRRAATRGGGTGLITAQETTVILSAGERVFGTKVCCD